MKIISYSLFGYDKESAANCFDFNSYLRGLMINIRLQQLLMPDWKIRLHVDKSTYLGFERMFELLNFNYAIIEVVICDDAPLTKAMLWRMKPAFDHTVERFICRDIEAPLMYKDVQAITQWCNSTKAAHAITASESHNIPMMGGMIGFVQEYFQSRTGFPSWDDMVNSQIGYETKGADQDLLNKFIYPKYANGGDSSIMQHYFKGMYNTYLDGFLTCQCPQIGSHLEDCKLNIKLDLPDEYRETDNLCGHIGAAGWYESTTFAFLKNYPSKFVAIRQIESLHPNIFNWGI